MYREVELENSEMFWGGEKVIKLLHDKDRKSLNWKFVTENGKEWVADEFYPAKTKTEFEDNDVIRNDGEIKFNKKMNFGAIFSDEGSKEVFERWKNQWFDRNSNK